MKASLLLTKKPCDSVISLYYSDITWASWRLNSLATGLSVQQFVYANNKENIENPYYCRFKGNASVTDGFSSKSASYSEHVITPTVLAICVETQDM